MAQSRGIKFKVSKGGLIMELCHATPDKGIFTS